jgi:hypothetical protein
MDTFKDNTPPDHSNGRGPDHGKPKPPETYKFRIDKADYEIENPAPTGRDLLILAGKNPPDRFQIFQRGKGGELQPVKLDDTVDLREPGVERFVTLPLDQTEGETQEVPPRRDFHLSENDTETLDRLGLRWETIRDGGMAAVVIRDYPIPSGYNYAVADIHLRIDPGYPDTQLDMVYVTPALARTDGQPIGALCMEGFAGTTWQRWSRHRTGANPWRPGVDDVGTHLALVDHWFSREFIRAAA